MDKLFIFTVSNFMIALPVVIMILMGTTMIMMIRKSNIGYDIKKLALIHFVLAVLSIILLFVLSHEQPYSGSVVDSGNMIRSTQIHRVFLLINVPFWIINVVCGITLFIGVIKRSNKKIKIPLMILVPISSLAINFYGMTLTPIKFWLDRIM